MKRLAIKTPYLIAGAGLLAYLLWPRSSSAATGAVSSMLPPPSGVLPIQAGTQNIPELPGVMAPTAGAITGANNFWNSLGGGGSLSSGWINFPSGSQSAAALFQIRYDVYGSPYIQWAGQVYILTGPDSMGNYTATQIQV